LAKCITYHIYTKTIHDEEKNQMKIAAR